VKAIGIRRETAGGYLKAADIGLRPPGGWGKKAPAKPANGVTADPGSVSEANFVLCSVAQFLGDAVFVDCLAVVGKGHHRNKGDRRNFFGLPCAVVLECTAFAANDNITSFLHIATKVVTAWIIYEWDEAKNRANLAKHGLHFAAAEQMLTGPCVTFVDDRFDYGERLITLGLLASRVVIIT
jgi:hypothetical protein